MNPDCWGEKWLQGAESLSRTLFLQMLVLSGKKYLLHPIVIPTTYQSLDGTGHLKIG